jgi:hypothetical protein
MELAYPYFWWLISYIQRIVGEPIILDVSTPFLLLRSLLLLDNYVLPSLDYSVFIWLPSTKQT